VVRAFCEIIRVPRESRGYAHAVFLMGPTGASEVEMCPKYVGSRYEIIALLGTRTWEAVTPTFFQFSGHTREEVCKELQDLNAALKGEESK